MKTVAVTILSVVISVAGMSWHVSFTPHPLNVGVSIFTNCHLNGRWVYTAPAYGHVDAEDGGIDLHRATGVPRGAQCVAEVEVMRNPGGGAGDPQEDYKGDSASISWTED